MKTLVPYRPTVRDRLAVAIANVVLRIATPEYRGFVIRAIEHELDART